MPVPREALLTPDEATTLRANISTRLVQLKRYWLPRDQRMDLWATMFFLLDVVQQMKPLGYRRFISNEPQTAMGAALSILTRNEAFWRIALNEVAGENMEERQRIGRVERTLQGMIYAADEQFAMRGLMPWWKQAVQQGLLRGWIAGKLHVTREALEYYDAPLFAEVFDSRLCYPTFDGFGMANLIVEKPSSVGELVTAYPDVWGELAKSDTFDPNTPATKIEYWSNDRGGRMGVNGVLAYTQSPNILQSHSTLPASADQMRWVIWPYKHGYDARSLPVVVQAVNGVNVMTRPTLGNLLAERIVQRAELLDIPQLAYWANAGQAFVAEMGRGLLAAVEEQVPQYNELIATIFQHFSIGTYGTWVFTTPTGEMPEFEPGMEGRVALRPEEKVERIEPTAINQDAYRLVQILEEERQKGTLSNILQAVMPFPQSGVLFQQIANAALNALEPYHDGTETFGTRIGSSVLGQLQTGNFKKFQVEAPGLGAGQQASYFAIEFDPLVDLDRGRRYRPRPVFKPALPDDLIVRIEAARFALDPRRPILSLITVLETILQVDDPAAEIDRIWEDIANTDPVIVLEQIASALERLGEEELAARIRETEFRTSMIEELQWRQQTGQVPEMGPGKGGMAAGGGAPEGMVPETGSPLSTSRGATPTGSPVGAAMGAMGERRGV